MRRQEIGNNMKYDTTEYRKKYNNTGSKLDIYIQSSIRAYSRFKQVNTFV